MIIYFYNNYYKNIKVASNLKLTRRLIIFREHDLIYDGSYTMKVKPIKTIELYQSMIQFLIYLTIIRRRRS